MDQPLDGPGKWWQGRILLLLLMLLSATAMARGQGVSIFADGFEPGRPSAWSCIEPPALEVTAVTPREGTAGTRIAIEGYPFACGTEPRVVLTRPNGRLVSVLDVLELTGDRLIARLDDAPLAGGYVLKLRRDGLEPIAAEQFEVRLPADLRFDPVFVSPGMEISLTGSFLGSEQGRIQLRDAQLVTREATVTSWTMDQDGDRGRVTFRVPTGFGDNGLNDVILHNAVGSVFEGGALAVTGIERDDTEGPRIVSAVAPSNTEVLVQFDEPILGGPGGAGNPSSYNISAADGAISLGVLTAEVLFPDLTVVRLTTRSQSALIYTLKVTHIQDLTGNPLAPPDILVDPSTTTFVGLPPSGDELVDSDDDGLMDHDELRGWTVTVTLLTGETASRLVTSDPDHPDTDGDGVSDAIEKRFSLDPRLPDTDGDLLVDVQEWLETFSNPRSQDSDLDGVADGSEFNFFRTSPILADSDGDQLPDGDEIVLGDRNPLVSDLPSPTIEVGAMNLQLDVRFLESTSTMTRELESRSLTSTLEQSNRQEVSNTNSSTQEAMVKLSVGTKWQTNASLNPTTAGAKFTTNINAEAGWTGSWTTSSTETSANETRAAYQRSLNAETEATEGATVTREVMGARLSAAVTLESTTSLGYTVRNLQLTALIQDPRDPTRLTPVATLLPDSEPPDGFALGPLTPERGPIVFANDLIFPMVVEDLMKNPRGLVFRISNFDIVDELGRNFVFTAQEVTERTAALVIDNGTVDSDGDGEGDLSQYLRISTGFGRHAIDTNGDGLVDTQDRRVVFDEVGNHVGITLAKAFEVAGFTRLEEATTPSDSLTDAEQESSYSIIREEDIERLFRIGRVAKDGINRKSWEILTPTGIDYSIAELDSYILKTDSDLKLAFVQDLDMDRIESRQEAVNNCSDQRLDSDDDGLDDRFESLIGWQVSLTGDGNKTVFTSCAREDTDGDGLTDLEEAPAILVLEDADGDGTPDQPRLIARADQDGTDADGDGRADDFVTDPTSADTDGDGVGDFDEVRGFCVVLLNATNPNPPECTEGPDMGQIFVRTDPNARDTDGDGAADGVERQFGGDPTVPDLDDFSDDDGDGLVNIVETNGWSVEIEAVSSSPAQCSVQCDRGTRTSSLSTSDPLVADTDMDGLLDGVERQLGTDPRLKDSDGDGLTDFDELMGLEVRDLGVLILDPLDADVDDDKRSDGAEAELDTSPLDRWIVRVFGQDPYRVFSHPLEPDADFDTLVDGRELDAGTDPGKANTDGDARDDRQELAEGSDPLVQDLRIEVTFLSLNIIEDCDDLSDGDFEFSLGVLLDDQSMIDLPFVQTDLRIPDCDTDDSVPCFNDSEDVMIESGTLVPFTGFTKRFGLAVFQEFTLAGSIQENDSGGPDTSGGFPYLLQREASTFKVDGSDRSPRFSGSELMPGTITGTFSNPDGCNFELEVRISVD